MAWNSVWKTKIVASSPITFWQVKGEKVEAVTDCIFLSFRITAHSDWHEIKKHLLLVRKAVTNLDSVLKTRDTTLLSRVCLVKAMVSPVVLFGCESWTIKKTEHQRIDAF